ncbi:MAG: indolepyruvate decarboxylase [Neolewinella sp.]|jgi:indolepyruvate decarboxylase
MKQTYTVGQYLVDRLLQIGLNDLFAIPGDYCADWVQNYVEPSLINRIGPTNELNAGYAADGYARLNGVGAICVTYSVGALSAVNAIAGAYVEKVPVIVINGAPSVAKTLQYQQTGFSWHHFINGHKTDLRIYENITVAAVRVDDPAFAPNQIDFVLQQCITQKGPVYLEITEDMYDLPCVKPVGTLLPVKRLSDADNLAKGIALLKANLERAKTPLIWTGVEIDRYGLQEKLEKLLMKLDIPYVSTLLGKASISEYNPLFAGVFDGKGSREEVQELAKNADFILGLGVWTTDINNLGTALDYGKTAFLAHDALHFNTNDNFQGQVLLEDIIDGLLEDTPVCQKYSPAIAPPEKLTKADPNAQVTYQGFYDFIPEYIDENTIIGGGTSLNYFGTMLLKVGSPGGFIAQAAYTDIGYVTPATTGACMAMKDDQRMMVFAGDGGFQMTAQCISTQTRLGLNPIIFIMDNGVYAIEQWLAGADVFKPGSDKPFFPLCELHEWEYSKLAEVFGCKGWKVATYGELKVAVEAALKNTALPSIIQVKIPKHSIPDNARWKVDLS